MRVVVFDVMDTLLRDPYRDAYEAATGLSFDVFVSVNPEEAYRALERSEIDESTYWTALKQAGISVDVGRFHAARRSGYDWLPGMRDVLHEAAAQHRVILSSNYPAAWIADVRSRFLRDVQADVCGSCELGLRKPSRGFFDRMADRLALDPAKTVLVDDSALNVEGAVGAGWHGVRYRDAQLTREALDALGFTLGASPHG
jgi:HAD superfamily hydrolase (TIGR01509 family)